MFKFQIFMGKDVLQLIKKKQLPRIYKLKAPSVATIMLFLYMVPLPNLSFHRAHCFSHSQRGLSHHQRVSSTMTMGNWKVLG